MEQAGKIANQLTGKIIGPKKYQALKMFDLTDLSEENLEAFKLNFKDLTIAEAIKMVEAYEAKYSHATGESAKKVAEYFERINAPEKPKEKKELTKEILWKMFDDNYTLQNSPSMESMVRYSRNPDSLENIKPLIYYFIGDFENFKKCKRLSKLSEPSFEKGLLIIGGYGNGKTSVMKALQTSLARTNISFKTKSTNDLVNIYEGCENQGEKDEFWQTFNSGTWNFDDILTERVANNYGKVNLMKDVLEVRYDKKKRTYCTCNYKDGTEESLPEGLAQFGEKYGSRVYDRLFAMFNIVEFKGKSFRK